MATKLEQAVIYQARLVLLGWMGDAVDGGKATREALPHLREAFDALEAAKATGARKAIDTESDRRGQVAYQAWRDACTRTGVNTLAWEALLQDEQYQWADVYAGVEKDALPVPIGT